METTETNIEEVSQAVATQPVTKTEPELKNNIFGIISFIGYFIAITFLFAFILSENSLFLFLMIVVLLASIVLGILGFIFRTKYKLVELSIISFAININIVFLLFVYILIAIISNSD